MIKVNLGCIRRFASREEPRGAKVKFEKKVVLKMARLHVLLLERNTMGNAYGVPGLVL